MSVNPSGDGHASTFPGDYARFPAVERFASVPCVSIAETFTISKYTTEQTAEADQTS